MVSGGERQYGSLQSRPKALFHGRSRGESTHLTCGRLTTLGASPPDPRQHARAPENGSIGPRRSALGDEPVFLASSSARMLERVAWGVVSADDPVTKR